MKKLNIGGICKKLFGITIGKKGMVIVSVLGLIVALLPLLRMAMYAVPWSDDYSYAVYTRSFINAYGAFPGAFMGAAYVTRTWWYCWQGTFSSIFLMAMMPEAFSEGTYWVALVAIILIFTMAAFVLCVTLSRKFAKADWPESITISIFVVITMLVLIRSAQQGFYWYNSAIHYTFMHGMLFLFVASLCALYFQRNTGKSILWAVLLTLLAVICSGSNFVSALQGFLIGGMFFAVSLVYKRQQSKYYVFPMLVYAVGLYLSISAPGNAMRSAQYEGQTPMEAVFNSFVVGAQNLWHFTDWITLVILAVYIFMMWNVMARSTYKFAAPLAITVLSFCFYCTGYTSSLYGMGHPGLSRTWNVVKFTYQILLFVNVAYWMGWGMRKWREKGRVVPTIKNYALTYVVAMIVVCIGFHFDDNQAGHFSSYGAYYYVHTGEAANYYNEWQTRFEEIKNGGEVVELRPLVWRPHLLCLADISSNPEHGDNTPLASWYDKQAVYVKVEE